MDRFTIKRLIVGILACAVGLMTLLTLAIPFTRVSDLNLAESGFSLLDFSFDDIKGADDWMGSVIGVLSLFQLLISLTTMVLSALSIFFFNENLRKRLLLGFTITCLAFTFLYMIIGIVAVSVYDTYYLGYSVYFDTSTLAYLGFIFTLLLFVAFIVCDIVIKERSEGSAAPAVRPLRSATQPVALSPEEIRSEHLKNVTDTLKQLKELLDAGILTQEEFDKKKKEVLDL